MRRFLLSCAALIVAGGPALAQEEPSLFEPAPTPPPAEAPAPKLPPPAPVAPTGPLSDKLDHERWLSMSVRERQTFVEGAVASFQAASNRIQAIFIATPVAQRDGNLAQFVRDHTPRRAAAAYLKDMEAIYLTEAGQTLPMTDCFLQAFRRLNAR